MTDPRYTDPRLNPRNDDPTLITPTTVVNAERTSGPWGWIAGFAVVALIAFVVIAGWNNSSNTASNAGNPTPVASDTAPMRNVTPPTTTGSGSTAPLTNPAPSATPTAPSATPSTPPATPAPRQ
ncbi:MAG: hypothetical protein Q8M24_26740 [Pseudolabrys sp.]|nr:hypothetical protein [Pseudolabrys sp.]MDP2299052.1 hypothetical protein [Pseudolabrys sp.]